MDTTTGKNWQHQYSAEEARWQDLQRIGQVLIPTLVLIFIAVMAGVMYDFLYSATWNINFEKASGGYWYVFRLAIVVLAPLGVSIAAIVLLYRSAIDYLRRTQARPPQEKLLPLLQRRLIGVPALPPPLNKLWKYPFVTIKEARDLPTDHWVRWLGGPATLVIYDGVALYLERGNQFSRVVGPGKPPMPFLDRDETVKAVVDLRPQVKEGKTSPWTKDGIQLEVHIRLECQVAASSQARLDSQNLVFPFDPQAVKKAVEFTAVKFDREKNELYESDWLDGVWGHVTGHINRHISAHTIDELALTGNENVGQSRGSLLTSRLSQDHINRMNAYLENRNTGAKILGIQIAIAFPKEIDEYRISYWEAARKRAAATRLGQAEADGIRVRQEARARTELDMLNAITDRLKDVDPENLTEPLLLSLTGILDNSLDDPLIRPIIAKNSLNLLEQLRKTLKDKF